MNKRYVVIVDQGYVRKSFWLKRFAIDWARVHSRHTGLRYLIFDRISCEILVAVGGVIWE